MSDMFPSALQLIEDGVDGFLCYSAASWFRALDRLASTPHLIELQGEKLRTKYESRWSPHALNSELVRFISTIPKRQPNRVFDNSNREDRPGGWSYFKDTKMIEISQAYTRVSNYVNKRMGR